ncbi:MAG: ComF family protein [Comamonadaceae bacterium]|nr:MAG: ComF family protein [Comamonadaceae bacterium]
MSLLPTADGLTRRVGAWLGALPSQCAVCHTWPARPLCDACVSRFAQPVPRCRTCALRVPAGVTQCGECLRHPPALNSCLAACDYAWPWTQCIGRFKFEQQAGWAAPLAQLMHSVPWADQALDAADRVLPMPLFTRRLRERGFNQALELARRLAPGRCDATLLLRLRDTPAQAGLSRAQRLLNLRGAFALEPLRAQEVRGLRIVLVDDVMTTGASLSTAAQVLRDAGAAHITALVLARTA